MKNKIWKRWICHKRNIRLMWKDLITGNGLHPFKWMHSYHTEEKVRNVICNTEQGTLRVAQDCCHDINEIVLRDWHITTKKCSICGKEMIYFKPTNANTAKEEIYTILGIYPKYKER